MTESLARRLIDSQFPDLSGEPIVTIGYGWDNIVFRIGSDTVFRFPRRKAAIDLLEREWRILPQLAAHLSIPYSRPLYLGEASVEFPVSFLGYNYLHGRYPIGLNDEQRILSTTSLAVFLRQLHAFPVGTAMECGAPLDHRNLLDMETRRLRMLEWLPSLEGHMGEEAYCALRQYLLAGGVDQAADKRVFLHGDLHFKNMLVDEDGLVSGIMDWGDMNVGHPACDLNVAYSYLPSQARQRFFAEYGVVDEETKELARLIAVYIPMLLMQQAVDEKDARITAAAIETIQRALSD
ncbi:phosphotransferase [Paenibacillus sp. D51F]